MPLVAAIGFASAPYQLMEMRRQMSVAPRSLSKEDRNTQREIALMAEDHHSRLTVSHQPDGDSQSQIQPDPASLLLHNTHGICSEVHSLQTKKTPQHECMLGSSIQWDSRANIAIAFVRKHFLDSTETVHAISQPPSRPHPGTTPAQAKTIRR